MLRTRKESPMPRSVPIVFALFAALALGWWTWRGDGAHAPLPAPDPPAPVVSTPRAAPDAPDATDARLGAADAAGNAALQGTARVQPTGEVHRRALGAPPPRLREAVTREVTAREAAPPGPGGSEISAPAPAIPHGAAAAAGMPQAAAAPGTAADAGADDGAAATAPAPAPTMTDEALADALAHRNAREGASEQEIIRLRDAADTLLSTLSPPERRALEQDVSGN
jgi:hypothetical protein